MKKRALSTALWFLAGWYVANVLAFVFGVSDVMGPIVGMAAAVLIGVDPFRVLWTNTPSTSTPLATESSAD